MSHYTKEDIARMVEEEDVEFIRLQFVDVFGILKNMAVTATQLDSILNHKCTFDGAAINGFDTSHVDELVLVPDLDSFTIFPWRPQRGRVARFICDVQYPDGTPFMADSRYILKKVTAEAAALGYQFDVGPECEFFLFHTDEDGGPTTISHERAGFFDLGPVDLGENARRDMVLTLEEMGFEIESSHHEAAPAQHRIDFRYDEALATADNIMTFKLAVKTIAKRFGLFASFMPKPKLGVNGSGMHLNFSVSKEGKNIFCDSADSHGLSQEAYYFIGGLMKHMRGMTAITNPLVNSYKRLVPGFEAPNYITWSDSHRRPLIRIPASRGEATRIELRCPDPAANPYLALAVCLCAGLDGLKNQILPPEPVSISVLEMRKEEREALKIQALPMDLNEAVRELEQDSLLCEVLGNHISRKYAQAKRAEWNDYRKQVTAWELDNYLYKI